MRFCIEKISRAETPSTATVAESCSQGGGPAPFSIEKRNAHHRLIDGPGQQANVGPTHVLVMAPEPVPHPPSIDDMDDGDPDNGQIQDRQKVKDVEAAGQVVDASPKPLTQIMQTK